MNLKEMLKRQVLVLALFALLLTLTTLFLRSATCFEGGTVVGFPWMFYNQCYGALIPGDGQAMDPAEFLPLGLVFDLAFWYLVSAGLVFLFRVGMDR